MNPTQRTAEPVLSGALAPEAPRNTLGFVHAFLQGQVRPGAFCIDATAGRGRDTALLCGLVGEQGRVLAFDIQEEAVQSTRALLLERGYSTRAKVIHDSHSHMGRYAEAGTVDCIVFNFGYLPGGDHAVFTRPDTSIRAIDEGLRLLKPGGVMSLAIYYGGDTGFEERDALLAHLKTLDPRRYTVFCGDFCNRPNNPPIPVFLWRDC
jgi:predicted methyltransferase